MKEFISQEFFEGLFIECIYRACDSRNVDARSAKFLIANLTSSEFIHFDEALEVLYGDGLKFYVVIDVGLYDITDMTFFLRYSNHPKVEFDKTMEPSDLGPFHSIGKMGIVELH
jgi:hypothetical protein